MKAISQDTPLVGSTARGSNSKLYALANKRTQTVDGVTSYLADGLEILNTGEALKAIKEYELKNVLSAPINGNTFYVDDISRGDLALLLVLKMAEGIDDTEALPIKWKCDNGIVGNITFGDVKASLMDGLTKKGAIIGVE